jgi:hypothetical protein
LEIVASADASFAEHEDVKSHSGGCIGLRSESGGSFFIFISSKQSVVAKSSCKADLISASQTGDYILWFSYILKQLGYKRVLPSVLEQDNQAAILLSKRGRGSF